MVGQVTGGNPKTTGVYYDDSWNHALLPAGTTKCAAATPGAEVTFFEQADLDPLALDAGQGLPGLPDGILQMTGNPTSLIDPAQLPVDPATCKPVYPHEYLKVNTIFEVARAAGLRTAWSDKHPAYEILNGPVGHRYPGPLHARDQQRRAHSGIGERLDDRQRADRCSTTATRCTRCSTRSTASTTAARPRSGRRRSSA